MGTNLELYPLDYPASLGGPTELELAVELLKQQMRMTAIQAAQIKRQAGLDTVAVQNTMEVQEIHDLLPRLNRNGNVIGTKGLYAGGETGPGITTSNIRKISFEGELITQLGIELSEAKTSAAGVNSLANAYFGGGNGVEGAIARFDKVTLQEEGISTIAATLSRGIAELVASGDINYGYHFCGTTLRGGPPVSTFLSGIEAMSYANDTCAPIDRNLGAGRSNAAIFSNITHAFIGGGKTSYGLTFTDQIMLFAFGTKTAAPADYRLNTQKAFMTGVGNASQGFFVGGANSAAAALDTIEKVDHGTRTKSVIGQKLAAAKTDLSATGNSINGYIAAGGTGAIASEFRGATPVSSVERLSLDGTSCVVIGATLNPGLIGVAAAGDYSPSVNIETFNVGDDSYYDGIYAKVDHDHDDRYPPIDHDHDDRYSKLGHLHDDRYLKTADAFLIQIGDVIISARIASAYPDRFMECDGRELSRTQYPELFAAITTAYGAGNGSTTFNIPNSAGRAAIGAGTSSASGKIYYRGTTGGKETHTLTAAEIPNHGHTAVVHDPAHGHSIYDPGHAHGVSDPGHSHAVYDPGHIHEVHTNEDSSATGSPGIDNGNKTGGDPRDFNTRRANADVSIYGAGTGIGIAGAYTGVKTYSGGTGISVSISGTTGGGNPHPIMPPHTTYRFFIRVK